MKEKPTYYGILPANVRYDKELPPMARILYSEITCLSNKEGKCFAGNEYFAELYEVDASTVSRWVGKLTKRGYLKRTFKYKTGTKEIEKRWLEIIQVGAKTPRGSTQKSQGGIGKKVKDNNTSNNNTSNNNSEQVAYNQKDYLEVMINSEKPMDIIIGKYLKNEKVPLPTKAIAQETYRRHLRYASKLTAWYESEAGKKLLWKAFSDAKENSEQNNYKFTLETVYKFLTK